MSGTQTVTVGDRGRLVLPADVRARTGITEGTELIIIETPEGLALLTRDQLKQRVRADLAGESLVEGLLASRRAAAADEEA